MDLGLEGRAALVSGSYRGTGAGIATALAREGARVGVHGFEPGQAEAVCDRLRAEGLTVEPLTGDIASEDGTARVVREAQERLGDVDVLVNNFGVAEPGDWRTSDSEAWISIYQRNVLSGVRLAQALAPGMRERGWGRIVWLGTIGSLRPAARMPHYYASKAALGAVCASLARELDGTGVTVNLVSPGLIATEEVRAWLQQRAERRGWGNDRAEVQRAALLEMTGASTGRIVEVEEVADVVAFVASDRAAALHGAQIRVDGGASALAL